MCPRGAEEEGGQFDDDAEVAVESAVHPSSAPATRTAASNQARNNFVNDPTLPEGRRLLAEFSDTFALTSGGGRGHGVGQPGRR